jgi:N-acetylglucosamine kinase-like BadF-type ATPase
MLILAVDQGGTKTDAIIADDQGRILGVGDDRSLQWERGQDERRALRMTRLQYAAQKAAQDAGIALTQISTVSASLIGADWDFEYPLGEQNIRNKLGLQDVTLYNDCIGAMRGGTQTLNRDCAIICMGTGANVAIQNRQNEQYIFAYYMKMEHQGAYALGSFVFQAVFDAECGLGPKTALTQLLLEKTGHSSADELYMHITTGRNETEEKWYPDYPTFGPLLFKAIQMNDKVADDYLTWLCKGLAHYITLGARRLSINDRPITVVLSGGVPKGGAVMRDRLEKQLHEALPASVCVEAEYEPVVGALLLGYDRLYPQGVPQAVQDRLDDDCKARKLHRVI